MASAPSSPVHEPPSNPGTPKSILKKGPTTNKNQNDVKLVLDGNVPDAEQQPDSPRHTKTKQFVEGKDGVVKRGERKSVNGMQPITVAPQDNNQIKPASGGDSDSDSDREIKKEEQSGGAQHSVSPRKDDKNAIQPRGKDDKSAIQPRPNTAAAQTSATKEKESVPASPRGASIFSKVFGKKKDKKGK